MAKAFMQDHHKVLETQYEAVRQLCSSCTENTYKLFCHILVCSLLRMKEEEEEQFSPVSSYLIDKSARGASWKHLRDLKLIQNTAYYHGIGEGKCREFKVTDSVLELFLELEDIEEYETALKVNLFNGQVTRTVAKNMLKDSTEHPEPKLIREAMKVFATNQCIYEAAPIKHHIAELKELVMQKLIELEQAGDSVESSPVLASLIARYRNDDLCFKSVLDQNPEDIGNGFFSFSPAYKAISTGRLHHIKGGLQSCSREMKKAAYSGVPDLKNYDLKASQVNIAIQLLEDAGISTEWLTTYRDTPNNKQIYAANAGLSIDTWKTCLLALLMGGHLAKTTKNADTRDNKILQQLSIEAQGEETRVLELLTKFTELVKPLIVSINEWHNWLIDIYIPQNQRQGGRERKYYIYNKAEKRLCVNDLPNIKSQDWLAKARVAAFLLQGAECTFINHLTLLGTKYNFKPIANEHDGLITLGLIPPEAVDEASALSGLKYAQLEQKSFLA